MMKDIDAVLFDLDGSLVDSMGIWKEIDVEYLGRYHIPLPEGLQGEIEGMSFSETASYFKERFCIPEDVDQIKEDWNRMAWDKYTHQVPLKDGAREFVEYCRANGIRLGIATSNSRQLVENVMSVHGILDYFDTIVTGCDVEKGKPAPDVYLEAARQCRVDPERCLVFEDIIPGIMAGKAAGMKVCAVAYEYSRHQEQEKRHLSDYFIKDYLDIMEKI
ncbi:MAG: HAD family phosphatase [Lachnospiraceae bacterium]|nr:HAD family phosphatase [Lachnospiraceae bacterium]